MNRHFNNFSYVIHHSDAQPGKNTSDILFLDKEYSCKISAFICHPRKYHNILKS